MVVLGGRGGGGLPAGGGGKEGEGGKIVVHSGFAGPCQGACIVRGGVAFPYGLRHCEEGVTHPAQLGQLDRSLGGNDQCWGHSMSYTKKIEHNFFGPGRARRLPNGSHNFSFKGHETF